MEEKQNLFKIVNCSHLIVFEILHLGLKNTQDFLEEIHHKTSSFKIKKKVYTCECAKVQC